MALHLDENTEERTPLEYVLGCGGTNTHHWKGRKHFVTWDGITYQVPSNVAVPDYTIIFVEDSRDQESIVFLSTKRFGIYENEKDYIPNTWDWDEIKKWAEEETSEALSHLIKL